MSKRARIWSGATLLFLVAGCTTREYPREKLTAAPSTAQSGSVAPGRHRSVKPGPAPLLPPAPAPSTVPTPESGSRVPVPARPPAGHWVSLQTWADQNPRARVIGTPTGEPPDHRVETPFGTLRLRGETRQAHVDGVLLWLGVAAVQSGSDLFLHPVDVRKNLTPLLRTGTPVRTARRTVVVDPGHGGRSTGTLTLSRDVCEKDLTLDWARRLQPLLERAGWRVVLTRTGDVDVSLDERIQLADRVRADFFLSLHFNSAYPEQRIRGIETYCLTPARLPSTVTRNYPDDLAVVHPNNAHDEENLRCALILHRALLRATGSADRGVRRARFMVVLRDQERPAVLLEGGFLSNPDEAARILSGAYRQRLAEAVASAFRDPGFVPSRL